MNNKNNHVLDKEKSKLLTERLSNDTLSKTDRELLIDILADYNGVQYKIVIVLLKYCWTR